MRESNTPKLKVHQNMNGYKVSHASYIADIPPTLLIWLYMDIQVVIVAHKKLIAASNVIFFIILNIWFPLQPQGKVYIQKKRAAVRFLLGVAKPHIHTRTSNPPHIASHLCLVCS